MKFEIEFITLKDVIVTSAPDLDIPNTDENETKPTSGNWTDAL